MMEARKVLTTQEACNYCKCSRGTLQRARKKQEITVIKRVSSRTGKVLYDIEELNRWLFGSTNEKGE